MRQLWLMVWGSPSEQPATGGWYPSQIQGRARTTSEYDYNFVKLDTHPSQSTPNIKYLLFYYASGSAEYFNCICVVCQFCQLSSSCSSLSSHYHHHHSTIIITLTMRLTTTIIIRIIIIIIISHSVFASWLLPVVVHKGSDIRNLT